MSLPQYPDIYTQQSPVINYHHEHQHNGVTDKVICHTVHATDKVICHTRNLKIFTFLFEILS